MICSGHATQLRVSPVLQRVNALRLLMHPHLPAAAWNPLSEITGLLRQRRDSLISIQDMLLKDSYVSLLKYKMNYVERPYQNHRDRPEVPGRSQNSVFILRYILRLVRSRNFLLCTLACKLLVNRPAYFNIFFRQLQ